MLIGCTGGSCPDRDKCAHHEQGTIKSDTRLCKKGEEEPMVIKEIDPTPIVRVVKKEEREDV